MDTVQIENVSIPTRILPVVLLSSHPLPSRLTLCLILAVDNLFSISTILFLQILYQWNPTVLWALALFTQHDSQGMHQGRQGH